jgi:hypothetical protein
VRTLAAALLAALCLAACGDDSDDGGSAKKSDKPAETAAGTACFDSWNQNASADVKGYTLAGVSEKPTMGGTWKGSSFEASTEADGVTVRPGDCVVAQVTTTETEYVFVESSGASGGPKAWHSLEEDGTPLEKPAAAQLEGVVEAKLKGGFGAEGRFEPEG